MIQNALRVIEHYTLSRICSSKVYAQRSINVLSMAPIFGVQVKLRSVGTATFWRISMATFSAGSNPLSDPMKLGHLYINALEYRITLSAALDL